MIEKLLFEALHIERPHSLGFYVDFINRILY